MRLDKRLIAQLSPGFNGPGHYLRKYFLFYSALLLTVVLYLYAAHAQPTAKAVIELQAQHKDVFQFFYKPEEDPDFTETNSVKQLIGFKKGMQTLSFEIPYGCKLENIRLDVGSNREQGSIELGRVWLIYKRDSLLLSDGDHKNFFVTNENVERSGHHLRLSATPTGAYDPYLLSGDLTMDYIDLTSGKNKLPGFLLLPFVVALLLRFLLFARRSSFLSSFYVAAPCVFVALLLLPGLNSRFDLYKEENREKRVLAALPSFDPEDILHYPGPFESYYNDNLGLRSLLVSLGGKIKYYCFGASAAPVETSVGKNGWMYLTGAFIHVANDASSHVLLSDTLLHRLVTEWEKRKHRLEKEGIHYYKAFWPEKHTVYPEYLPLHMTAILHKAPTRLEQVEAYMAKSQSDVHVVDVTELLKKQKTTQQVYLKYDSHWNAAGAFIGYTALMSQVAIDFPQLKPHPLSDYEVSLKEKTGGDLADMLDLEEKEMIPVFKLKNDSSRTKELPFLNYPPNTFIFENRSASTNLSVLVYRDSYTTELVQFLTPHFRNIVLLWGQPFSYDFIKTMHPDIVIESRVCRFIDN